ncbi:MAG: ABC transporter permease [Erysipelotrichaceae bacterium]|nr:ABC transporter permease [Erysipelotrichaceae bacterium]
MFHVDTYRLIKKTKKRFISLTLIVMIGVAFMMGLMSSPDVMKESVDIYNDQNNLQDIQIYSSYGFCLKDIIELRNVEGVKEVFSSRFKDVYCQRNNGDEFVARVEEVSRSVNKISLLEGRLPENKQECVILTNIGSNNSYKLGDKLRFYLNDDELSDYLEYENYEIVGFVSSPAYSAKTLGSSTLNNEDLSLIVYVNNNDLKASYYSTVYLTLEGSDKYTSYTKDYQKFIDDSSKSIENFAYIQEDYFRDITLDKAQKELDKHIAEFNEKKTEGEEKLNEARQELEDANIQIVSLESNIKTMQGVVNTLERNINSYKRQLKERQEELGISDEEISNSITSAGNQLYDKINSALENNSTYQDLIANASSAGELGFYENLIESSKQVIDETKREINSMKYQLQKGKEQYKEGLLEYTEGLNEFNEEIEKAEIELAKTQQTIDELPNAKWTILDRSMHYSSFMYEGSCNQMRAIGLSLPFLFYLVAALVCLTTMTRLIDEQRGQIGIFRALGFSKKQIVSKYLIYALCASLIGSILGAVIGQTLFPTVIYNAWRLMYSLPPMKVIFPIKYALICMLAFSLLMMAVTYLVINRDMKEVPASLMRPKAPKEAKETFIEKITFIWKRLSFTSKITVRNLIRYKSRFFMTVIGVAGCTGLLIIGYGIKDSISDVVSLQFSDIFNYDYQLTFDSDEHFDKNLEILVDNKYNETVSPFMAYSSAVYFGDDSETLSVQIFDTGEVDSIMNFRHDDRKTPLYLDNRGVIISEKFARNNNIKAGDTITMESSNGIKAEVKVTAICEMYFQHYCFMSNSYYEKVFNEKVHNNFIAVKTDNLESLNADIELLEDYVSLVDFNTMIVQFENMLEALNLIVGVVIITAGSLAFVVLMNLTQVNISERMREIATLKVLGFNKKEVDSYIFKEIMILSIIGALVGLPLGTLEHHFVMNVIDMEMVTFGMNISFMSYFISFMITIVFTLIVLFFSRKPLREIKMVESLKSVE